MKIKMFTIESESNVPTFRVEVRDPSGIIMIHECANIQEIRDSIVELQMTALDAGEVSAIEEINDHQIDSQSSWQGWFFFVAGQLAVQDDTTRKVLDNEN